VNHMNLVYFILEILQKIQGKKNWWILDDEEAKKEEDNVTMWRSTILELSTKCKKYNDRKSSSNGNMYLKKRTKGQKNSDEKYSYISDQWVT
jgi:hypothetical protein